MVVKRWNTVSMLVVVYTRGGNMFRILSCHDTSDLRCVDVIKIIREMGLFKKTDIQE